MIYEPLHQEGVAAVVSSSTHPPRSSVTMSSSSPRLPSDPLHRSILAVDIEGYSRPERTNPIRARLRDSLYLLLDQAIGSLGIAPDQYEPPTDQGDGALARAGAHPAARGRARWRASQRRTRLLRRGP